MAIRLRQSTASQEVPLGTFVDSTDGNTEEGGLTIANTDIKLWKMGATTLANKNSGGATVISNGVYQMTLDATDTNTLGALIIFVHVTGALPVKLECEVVTANVYDALIAGTDLLDVSTTQLNGNAVIQSGGRPEVNVSHFGGAAGAFAGGRPAVNTTYFGGTAGTFAGGLPQVTTSSASNTAITAAVWTATHASYVTPGQFGFAVKPMRSETAQAGMTTSITLDTGASATTDFYVNQVVGIYGGTGVGQGSIITAYNGSTKVATLNDTLATAPDATSLFKIFPSGSIPGATAPTAATVADAVWDELRSGHAVGGSFGEGITSVQGSVTGSVAGSVASVGTGGITSATLAASALNSVADAVWDEPYTGHVTAGTVGRLMQAVRDGTAQAGAATSITLDASASSTTDFYKGCAVELIGGLGVGQGNVISAYNGTTKVATVESTWVVNPDSSSVFVLFAGSAASTSAGLVDLVWDEARSAHTTAGSFGQGAASVQGNVTGSVASVSGAVGSVTGAVGSVTGSVGSVTGAVGSVTGAVGSVTAAVTADTVTDKTGYALTAAADNAIADALLARNVAGGSSAGRLVKEALYMMRNKWVRSGGTLTVYEVDDTTAAYTVAYTETAVNAITTFDPA